MLFLPLTPPKILPLGASMYTAPPFLENDPFSLLKRLGIQHDMVKELLHAHCPHKPSLSLSSGANACCSSLGVSLIFPFFLGVCPQRGDHLGEFSHFCVCLTSVCFPATVRENIRSSPDWWDSSGSSLRAVHTDGTT